MAKGTRWTQADIDRLQQPKLRDSRVFSQKQQPASFALGRLKAGTMNKTEAAYSKYLETQKQFGDVAWYEFEPMNLRLADKCFYKVDFLVMLKSGQLEVHEVKGYWTDDALVKIKTAAEKFPFRFISVILKKGQWEIREF